MNSSGSPANADAARAAWIRSACSAGSNKGPPGARESSMFTPTAPAAMTASTVTATSPGPRPYPPSISAVTGMVTAAAISRTRSIISARVRRCPSQRPSDQAMPPLVVAIARAPASAITTALPASQAFGRTSTPAACSARSFAAAAFWAVPAMLSSLCYRLRGPCPGASRARPCAASDADQQLVVDLDELRDQAGEPAGDQLLIDGRAGVRVVGGVVGEVLDEQQVVGPGRVAIDPERQRARLLGRPLGRELLDDGFDLGLLAGLEIDREHLCQHEQLPLSQAQHCASDAVHDAAAAQGCLATSGRDTVLAGQRLKEPCPDTASAGVAQRLYLGCDHLLSSGDDRDLLPAWLWREAAGGERADLRA